MCEGNKPVRSWVNDTEADVDQMISKLQETGNVNGTSMTKGRLARRTSAPIGQEKEMIKDDEGNDDEGRPDGHPVGSDIVNDVEKEHPREDSTTDESCEREDEVVDTTTELRDEAAGRSGESSSCEQQDQGSPGVQGSLTAEDGETVIYKDEPISVCKISQSHC